AARGPRGQNAAAVRRRRNRRRLSASATSARTRRGAAARRPGPATPAAAAAAASSAAPTPRPGGAALRGRDLGLCHRPRQLRDQALEEASHAFLLAPDRARELDSLAIADGLGERFDRRVGGDLLRLVGVLGLGVLELA